MRKPWQIIFIGGLLLLVVGGFCGALYWWQAGQMEKALREREISRVNALTFSTTGIFRRTVDDLLLFAANSDLRDYLRTGDQDKLDRVLDYARTLSQQHASYDQIRYLDTLGKEILRVDRGGEIIPPAALQNKWDRPYFQQAKNLPAGGLYISALDLSVEDHEVGRPLKPMLRFVTPVFDAEGRQRGICIINYLANDIFRVFRDFASYYAHRARVLNGDGYWLKAARPDWEWGFMLPGRAEHRLARTAPDLWQEIARSPAGQQRYHGGLFTWRRFAPAQTGVEPTVVDDRFLVIASEVSAAEWTGLFADLRRTLAAVALILTLLNLVGYLLFLRGRRRQRDLDQFFTINHDLLCITDFAGTLQKINPAWADTLGYSAAEMLNRRFFDFIHPDDLERTQAETIRLAGGGATFAFENRYRTKDGAWRWLSWSARAMPQEKRIYAAARDITIRKQTETRIGQLNQDLQQHTAALEAANRELESFSYTVSHDLRAPLRHIDGFVGLLQRHMGEELDDKSRHYLKTISTAAKQMGLLIDDLLSFSRMARAHVSLAPVDHNALIDEVIRTGGFDALAPAVEWRRHVLPGTQADRAMLRQVWVNLIDNAVKYSRRSPAPRIEIGGHRDEAAGEAVFFVRDNGVGFDMHYVDKLFGVFQRLHAAAEFEGTGIGLANVRRIITRHGGRTWAEGQVGAGATIHFTLPLHKAISSPS